MAMENVDNKIRIIPAQLYDSTLTPFMTNMYITPATDKVIDIILRRVARSFSMSEAKINVKIGMVACKIPASDVVI